MPTKEEYDARFDAIIEPIVSQGAGNKREAQHIGALADHAISKEKLKMTSEISDQWKSRFKEIKDENDAWQKNLVDSYKEAKISIHDTVLDLIEGAES